LKSLSKFLIANLVLAAATCTAKAADQSSAALTVAPAPGIQSPAIHPAPGSDPSAPVLHSLNVEIRDLTGWQPVTAPPLDNDPDKAAMLKEFGCRSIWSKAFQRGQRRINATVYGFSSSEGAYAAYNLLRRGSSTFVAKGDASSEDDQNVSIWKERFFISVGGTSEDDEESKAAVSKIANQLTGSVEGHGQLPSVISRMPSIDRVHGSEKVVMGPISARRFFPAPLLNKLSFPNSTIGGIADYQFQAPFRERMKLLMLNYPTPGAAAEAYTSYTSAVEEQHPNTSDVPEHALFKMANGYLLCELRDQRILLITGARKKSAPTMLARQVL
jgi:hypothetical protein